MHWTVTPGRVLCYDGRPLVYITQANPDVPGFADPLAAAVVRLLNKIGASPATILTAGSSTPESVFTDIDY